MLPDDLSNDGNAPKGADKIECKIDLLFNKIKARNEELMSEAKLAIKKLKLRIIILTVTIFAVASVLKILLMQ